MAWGCYRRTRAQHAPRADRTPGEDRRERNVDGEQRLSWLGAALVAMEVGAEVQKAVRPGADRRNGLRLEAAALMLVDEHAA